MKRFYFKKEVTMILFFSFLMIFSLFNMVHTLPFLSIDKEATIKENIHQNEAIMKDKIAYKYTFIESYGYLQKLLMKKEFNNFQIVKDNVDSLYLEQFENGAANLSAFNMKLQRFQQVVEQQGGHFLAFVMPDKHLRNKVNYPKGYPYNYVNETLDSYKAFLQAKQIPYFDVRQYVEDLPFTHSQLFYKSDHHWRSETAFKVYQELLKTLKKEDGLDLDPSHFYADEKNYNFLTYPDMFLGSIGRKTGASYTQVDDFTFIYPKYATDFTMKWSLEGSTFVKTGRFETTLANPSYLQHKQRYDEKSDTYSMYLDGNAAYTSIRNQKAKNSIRVLFLKDSYSLPLIAFFANHVKEVDVIDPRYTKEDLAKYINQHSYDYVFCTLSASSLQENNLPSFS